MAKAASSEAISDAIRPADFRGSVNLIRTIPAKKEKIAEINGTIGDIWSKASEGKKVHKEACKMFARLDKKEEMERAQILRDLMKLVEHSGWDTEVRDLVDLAEMDASPPPAGKGVPDLDGEEDEKSEDDGDADLPVASNVMALKAKQSRVRKAIEANK